MYNKKDFAKYCPDIRFEIMNGDSALQNCVKAEIIRARRRNEAIEHKKKMQMAKDIVAAMDRENKL